MLRPRTTCVYCGKRISGNGTDETRHKGDPWSREYRAARRVACAEHWRLVLNDWHLPMWWQVVNAQSESATGGAEESVVA